jgi:hypothetical protein
VILISGFIYVDAHDSDIFPKEPATKSNLASIVLFASAVFVLAVYWLFLPRKIYVTQDGIKLKFGGISWNVPYKTIESIKPAKGMIVWWAHSFSPSYGSQIEIVRKNRLKIRISPSRRDEFLHYANRTLADWTHLHGSDTYSG